MQGTLKDILFPYTSWFHEEIPVLPHNRYIQAVFIRETKSHSIFTTEGETLDTEQTQLGLQALQHISRVLMFKRKQIAVERRTGKALLRERGLLTDMVIAKKSKNKGSKEKDKEAKSITLERSTCQIMGSSCGGCPDCLLYGFAATKGNGSQTSRIMTDSGYSLRDYQSVMRDIKLNAIQDTTRGGVAGSAFAHREHILPQVFFPTVVTMHDVTKEEFLYAFGNVMRTTRYGAESHRLGVVRNHVLGIYCGDTELFSNLELTQCFADKFLIDGQLPQDLTWQQFKESWSAVEKTLLDKVYARWQQIEPLDTFLKEIQTLYRDENNLNEMLERMNQQALTYYNAVTGNGEEGQE